MDPRFPRSISAVRIASFISTAAWIQGTTAEEAALPPEVLNNFLRRHGVGVKKARQTPAPAPAAEEGEEDEEEDEDEEEEGEKSSMSSGDSTSEEGVSSATGSSGASSVEGGEEEEDDDEEGEGEGDIPEGATPGSQAAITGGDPSGLETIDPGPNLSPGALAAIIVWSIIGFVAILGVIFFFVRRRRRARQRQEDDEEGRSREPMAMQGAAPSVIEPVHLRPGSQGSVPPAMEPVYLRPESQGAIPQVIDPMQQPMPEPDPQFRPASVAPSGQWMAVPPWQEEPPTWKDPHPWRTSTQPSIAPVGLPANPSPRATRQGAAAMAARQQGVDRQSKFTTVTESTIFAYR